MPNDCKNLSDTGEPTTGVYAVDEPLTEQLNPNPNPEDPASSPPAKVPNVAVSGKTEAFQALSSVFTASTLVVLGAALVG